MMQAVASTRTIPVAETAICAPVFNLGSVSTNGPANPAAFAAAKLGMTESMVAALAEG